MTSIIRRHEPPVRPVIEPEPYDEEPADEPAVEEREQPPKPATGPADPDPVTGPGEEQAPAADRPGEGPRPPLFHVMAAVPESGATTLAAWCACADEVQRDTRWRPSAGHSPYLVLTAPKSPDGVRAARQLAGALSHTVGGGAQVAAIALLEDQPRPTLALRELIDAAERAGIPIHTLIHDPRMRLPTEAEQTRLWTPQNSENRSVPTVLTNIYRHVFHRIAEQENSR
ncbi:hypothetical protein [Nocardia sp. alder85J]|uniref:hypothetical protein n=1 Tax=Nocardia sp. alder85J TaxID=2862949 RepID=UPI001CD6FEB2|nr:hypothetical protein [Nocardia sp. alder85J]MCX4099090.1 hypothetical protein [Nocardia sp. alder85J]